MFFILKIILIFIAVIFLIGRYLEYKSLYYPLPKIENTPKDIGLDYIDDFVQCPDGVRVNLWLAEVKDPKAVVLFAHGNGGNIGHRLDKLAVFNQLGVDFCIFDYRGYGHSQGRPCEQGFYLDIQTVYKYLKQKYPDLPLIVYGESLGGAVAIDLAARNDNFPIDGLIVEGAFTSIRDMAQLIYPVLPTVFLKTGFNSISKISGIKVPKLHFHSEHDDIIPYNLGENLFESGPDPKRFVILEGFHNDGFFVSEKLVRKELAGFISQICRP